jgi:outer membrane protein assembly factor BamD
MIILWAGLIVLAACAPKRQYAPTPEGEFEAALDLYQKGKYSKAIDSFKQLIYKYPGSDLVEHSRFYLADSYFLNQDYVLSADEFERLNREFPMGRFSDVALFKAGLSYEKQSRRPERDQNETIKALETLETLLSKYPNTKYADTVRVHTRLLKDRLALKEFDTAQFYYRYQQYDSAIIYFKSMLENYPESTSVPASLYYLYQSSAKMGYPDDAREARERLCKEFPGTPYAKELSGKSEESLTRAVAPDSGKAATSDPSPHN